MNIYVPIWLIAILKYGGAAIAGAIVWGLWESFRKITFGE